jgi:hypothetical protein
MFYATIGIAAEYAHPVEAILTNGLPTLMAVCSTGNVHMVTAKSPQLLTQCIYQLLLVVFQVLFWFFLFLRIWESTESHSGFAFPFSPWSVFWWQG